MIVSMPHKRISEHRYVNLAAVFIIIIIMLYVLTARFWEPGGESWGAWASATILKDNFLFPVFSKGPVYVVYLSLFQLFPYPLSIRLEYIITHLFCYFSLYFMMTGLLARWQAILLLCAWIPLLSVTEGGAVIAGMGFLALYFGRGARCVSDDIYFSPLLMLAAFCHTVYLPFLMGHVIGVAIQRYRTQVGIFRLDNCMPRHRVNATLVNGILLLLLLLTLAFPVRHPHYDNHMMIDPTYSPVPLKGNLTTSFFHLGTYKWMMRNIPESEWMAHDWYINKKRAFGDSNTIVGAILSKPGVFIENFVENLHVVNRLPVYLLAGGTGKITSLSINFFMLVGLLLAFTAMLYHYWVRGVEPLVLSITLGTVIATGAMLVTSFNERYIITLLPSGLMALAHIDKIRELMESKRVLMWSQKYSVMIAIILVMAGIITNEWFLPDIIARKLTVSYRIDFWILNVLFVVAGVLILYRRDGLCRLLKKCAVKRRWELARNMIILISVPCVLFAAPYSYGWAHQLEAVGDGRPLVDGAKEGSFSMLSAHEKLSEIVKGGRRVIASEHKWLVAFTDADFRNVYQMHSIPPVKDDAEKAKNLLAGMDIILVSDLFAESQKTIGSSKYLRYHLHVQPFLKEALHNGWTVERIKDYGNIYRKPG